MDAGILGWDNDYDDYYWVPGTWVEAPEPGFFWTPGYWAWGGRGYFFHEGYWGPHVGFTAGSTMDMGIRAAGTKAVDGRTTGFTTTRT